MKPLFGCIFLLTALFFPPSNSWPAEPAAIVEEVSSVKTNVEMMDYLTAGSVVELGTKGQLILGYLNSCWREEIRGGRVTVGKQQSKIQGGRVNRTRVECDGGQTNLAKNQAGKSGVIVYRVDPSQAPKQVKPQLTIYAISPVFILPGGGEIRIKRLDRKSEPLRIAVKKKHVDLADLKQGLIPGGTYLATAGDKSVVFEVDPFAASGKTSLVGRVIRF